jgi:hypothetical protein
VLSAPDVNALTLPPLLEPEVSGLEVTADAPEISSTVDRSATTVTRSTRLTYVAKEPGTYTLPSIEVSYWSTSANAIRKRTLPAVHFDVAAAPAVAEEIALPPDTDAVATPPPSRWASIRRAVRQWWPVVVGAVALTWLGWRLLAWLGPIVKRRRAEARQRRLESEDHYFDEVRRAAHSGDLRATHAAALAWLTRFAPLGGPASLTALAERVGDVGMRGRMDAVNSSLFGRQATGDSSRALASQLERDLDDARQRLLSDDRSRPGVRHLGPLNPI